MRLPKIVLPPADAPNEPMALPGRGVAFQTLRCCEGHLVVLGLRDTLPKKFASDSDCGMLRADVAKPTSSPPARGANGIDLPSTRSLPPKLTL